VRYRRFTGGATLSAAIPLDESRRTGGSLLYILGLGWLGGLEHCPRPELRSDKILINRLKIACDSTVANVKRALRGH
jgi:hypothetical protein